MSFRRDKEKSLQWQKWLRQHRDEIMACGVPPLVSEEMGAWYYFLDHGYFTPLGSGEPIIDVDQMTRVNAERLCLFLEQDDLYPESDALNRLQFLLKRERHAKTGG